MPKNETKTDDEMGPASTLMSKAEIMADLDIQLKEAQLALARAGLQDAQEQLALRAMTRAKIVKDQRDRARELDETANRMRQKVLGCPHKKGGTDLAGFYRGTNDKRCVVRFMLPNADYLNICTRCGNLVIAPLKPVRMDLDDVVYLEGYGFQHPNDFGYFDKGDKVGFAGAMNIYKVGVATYNAWLNLPTDNIASTACRPGQTGGEIDWVRYYLFATHEAQLIPIFQAERWPEAQLVLDAAS